MPRFLSAGLIVIVCQAFLSLLRANRCWWGRFGVVSLAHMLGRLSAICCLVSSM